MIKTMMICAQKIKDNDDMRAIFARDAGMLFIKTIH